MADWFVDALNGSDTLNVGDVFDDPKKTLMTVTNGMLNDVAPGDVVYVTGDDATPDTQYVENHGATGVTITKANAAGDKPIRIIAVADFNSGAPDTIAAAQAVIKNDTGTSADIEFVGSFILKNFSIEPADDFKITASDLVFELADSRVLLNNAGAKDVIVTGTGAKVVWNNVELITTHSSSAILVNVTRSSFNWRGGKLTPTAQPTNLFEGLATGGLIALIGVDLSAYTGNIIESGVFAVTVERSVVRIIGCDLHASVTISAATIATPTGHLLVDYSHTADTIVRELFLRGGEIKIDTGVALDWVDFMGDNTLSYKYTPDNETDHIVGLLTGWPGGAESPVMALATKYTGSVAGNVKFTVECVDDFTTAPTASELWLDVYAFQDASSTMMRVATTRTWLGEALTASAKGAGDWAGEGAGFDNFTKLELTLDVDRVGPCFGIVSLAKATSGSEAVYVDPLMLVAAA